MSASKGSVRRGQLITTYGVGALVAVDDESVMVAGLDDWRTTRLGSELIEPRLHMQGKKLRLPPGGDGWQKGGKGHIPVVRFPRWCYCTNPSCRRLDDFGRIAAGRRLECGYCGTGRLVPSRFIAICKRGHIEDFPYAAWVHRGKDGDTSGHTLRLQMKGGSGSLGGIVVECADCGAEESLEGAFDKDALVGVRSCGGRRPWLGDREDCGQLLRTTQRGASNVWFPIVRSVLSIPPWSDGLQQFVTRYWSVLRLELDGNAYRQCIADVVEQSGARYAVDEVIAAVRERKGEQAVERSDDQLRLEEFRALCRGREADQGAQFEAKVDAAPDEVDDVIDLVSVVSRLREVRALTGFTRLHPGGDDGESCTLANDADWLPAIAVHGEGVFLRLNADAVRRWESQVAVVRRVGLLRERWRQSFFYDGRSPSAGFLLAHAFAHCLIDQLSLQGGYPAASLRERIYATEEGAGVLIYTAAADSAGSLGGLIAQARPERLGPVIVEAVRRYRWCSSDPVCSEIESQGVEGLNLAACHGCALVPETSCEHRNTLLDRALLVGLPDEREFGYFHELAGD